jgi:hypothetical protein
MLHQVKPIAPQPSSTANGPCQDCAGSGTDADNYVCWACDGSGFEPVYVVAGVR